MRIYGPKLQLEIESCFEAGEKSSRLHNRMLDEPEAVSLEFGYLVEASYEVDAYDSAAFISAGGSFLIVDEILTDLAHRFEVNEGLDADFGRFSVSTRELSLPRTAAAGGNMFRHILEWEQLPFDDGDRTYITPGNRRARQLFERQMQSIEAIREAVETRFRLARYHAAILLDILCSSFETRERSYEILGARLLNCCRELALRAGVAI
jgi:hypothetical protein